MSRRELERRKYREALVPGLVLSAVAHALLLGLGTFGVPPWTDGEADREARERAERWKEESIEVVTVRLAQARTAAESRAGEASTRAGTAEAPTAAASAAEASTIRTPSSPAVALEPVDAASPVSALRAERREEERLSASDLASLFPGRSEMPKPTSRAARETSGEARDAGDRFRAVGGTRRAAPRGGGCVVRPGSAINRRLPQGITIGGG